MQPSGRIADEGRVGRRLVGTRCSAPRAAGFPAPAARPGFPARRVRRCSPAAPGGRGSRTGLPASGRGSPERRTGGSSTSAGAGAAGRARTPCPTPQTAPLASRAMHTAWRARTAALSGSGMRLGPAPEVDQLGGEFGGDVLPDRNDFERCFSVQSRFLAQWRCGAHAYFFAGAAGCDAASRCTTVRYSANSSFWFLLASKVASAGAALPACLTSARLAYSPASIAPLRSASTDLELLAQADFERDRALHAGVAGLEFLQRQRLVLVGVQRAEDGLAGWRLRGRRGSCAAARGCMRPASTTHGGHRSASRITPVATTVGTCPAFMRLRPPLSSSDSKVMSSRISGVRRPTIIGLRTFGQEADVEDLADVAFEADPVQHVAVGQRHDLHAAPRFGVALASAPRRAAGLRSAGCAAWTGRPRRRCRRSTARAGSPGRTPAARTSSFSKST